MRAARLVSRPPAPPRTATARDAMRGPKRAAGAILVFFAGSLLAVHLAYEADAAPPPVGPGEPPASSPVRAGPAAPAAAPGQPPGAAPVAAVAPERAAPSGSDPREVELGACVERIVGAAGLEDVKPTAPGRWPAIKRAREERRLKRLAARADCERELPP